MIPAFTPLTPPAADHRLRRIAAKDAFVEGEPKLQSSLALQGTACIEQCAQTHRAARLRSFRTGSDLGGPLARRAEPFGRHWSTFAPTTRYQSGGRRHHWAASDVSAGSIVYQTNYGPFDGPSWERLCQLIFKRKFSADGYLHIPATPGDYGLEGFTKTTGCGYQCYCPDRAYPAKDLYEKQRDKVTTDLKKLKDNEADLKKVLGTTKLRRWHLVTPVISHHDLIKHAQTKETEVRGWNLSIIDNDFQVLVHDADHYAAEIQEMQFALGKALDFGGIPAVLPELNEKSETYEKNILRKTRTRLASAPPEKFDGRVARLYQKTLREFLDHGPHLKRINDTAPTVHSRLARLINGYEAEVGERCFTWEGTPQELTDRIRDGLTERIVRELAPSIGETDAADIARMIVARWIAVCEVDYD